MPTDQEYFDAIGRAGLVFANETLALINGEKAGCVNDWGNVLCEAQKIECAEFFYAQGDYVSDDSILFYEQMLDIAGTQFLDVEIDPNAQMPNTTIIVSNVGSQVQEYVYDQSDLIDAGGGNYYLPFIKPAGGGFPANSTAVTMEINGISQFPPLDVTFTPARIYGFANNESQTIKLYVAIAS